MMYQCTPNNAFSIHRGSFDLPKWVSIDADIFYKRMCFEEGFHLAQADILAKLKLNQVLLAVDDPQSTWKTKYSNFNG